MNTSKKIISLLMCMLMVLTMVPIMPGALQKAYAEELTKISSLEATSTFADRMKVGKTVPGSGSFGLPVVTVGQPAIVNPNMMFEVYKKNEGGVFSKVSSNTPVEPGIYQFKTYVSLIQGRGYELDPAMTVTIDGKTCTHNGIITVRNVNVDTITITSGEYEVAAPPELVFTDSTNLDIPMGEVDKPIKSFSVATYVNGGTAPYTFSKKSGPEWITVSSDGTVSGTPTQVVDANEDLVVRVNDSTDPVQTAEISISVGKTYSPEAVTYVNLAYISLDNIFNIGNTVTIPSNSDVKVTSSSLSDSTVIAISNDIGESPKWQKFENNVWTDLTSADVFERGGTYKLKGISFYADYTKVKFDEDIVVYVNGKEWNITYNGRNPGYGYVDIESPELILREELKKENVTLNLDVYTYDGSAKEPTAIVKNADNEVLVEGTDYTVTYINNINEGAASVIITGVDEYKGEIIKTFTINPCPHTYDNACDTQCNMCNELRAITHTGGTATCTAKAKCTVCGAEYGSLASHKEVTLAAKSATYTSTGLTAGKKCSVCGKITVAQQTVAKLTLGKVTGLKAKKVKVAKKSEITLTWTSLGDGVKYEVYVKNGKKWTKLTTTSKTSYTVKKDGKKKYLKADKEYQFRVRAVVDDIKGKYSSTLKVETIPATAKLTLKAGKKQLTASWKSVSDISGYEVQYSTSKKFTKKTTKTVKVKKSSKKTTIKKLTKGKKYYVRIRTYKTVDGKKIYSSWSTVKNVKVK